MDSGAPLPLRIERGELSSRCIEMLGREIEFSAALDPFDISEINGDRLLVGGGTYPFLLISNRENCDSLLANRMHINVIDNEKKIVKLHEYSS